MNRVRLVRLARETKENGSLGLNTIPKGFCLQNVLNRTSRQSLQVSPWRK